MSIFQWLSSNLLGIFTAVLAGATIILCIVTGRYSKATREYVRISEKLFLIESVNYLDGLYSSVLSAIELKEAQREAVMETPKGINLSQEKTDRFHKEWVKNYRLLVDKLGEHLAGEESKAYSD